MLTDLFLVQKKVTADIALNDTPSQSYGTSLAIWDHTDPISQFRKLQVYDLPPNTSECTRPNPSHAGWYSFYLPRRDGRLTWHSWLDSAPAGSRASDLSIMSQTPNRCTTKKSFLNMCRVCELCGRMMKNGRMKSNGILLIGCRLHRSVMTTIARTMLAHLWVTTQYVIQLVIISLFSFFSPWPLSGILWLHNINKAIGLYSM